MSDECKSNMTSLKTSSLVYSINRIFLFRFYLNLTIICSDLSSSSEHLPDLISQTTDNHESSTSIDDIRKMTCSSPLQQQYTNLTVLDVYDEAALIGKDFERIIEG